MAIEHARTHTVSKPWGIVDPRPWSNARHDGEGFGEIWYERPGSKASNAALLLKLLFTSQPLSIQVHPDDACARSIGLANGKSEAWHDAGKTGMVGLVAYTGDGFVPDLLRRPGHLAQTDAGGLQEVEGHPIFTGAGHPDGRTHGTI